MVLKDGRIAFTGTAAALRGDPDPYLRKFVGTGAIEAPEGVVHDADLARVDP